MKTFSILLFFLSCFLEALPGNVRISGKAKSYPGADIEISMVDDYFTFTPKILNTSTISIIGDFNLNVDVPYTTSLSLRIGQRQLTMYAEPGKNYDIIIYPPDSIRPGGNVKALPYKLNSNDTLELNNLIRSFNFEINDFIYKNYKDFLEKRIKNKLEAFKIEISKKYKNITNEYFLVYMKYTFAAFEESSYRNKEEMANEYLNNSPVYCNNEAYAGFFNQFMLDYFLNLTYKKSGSEIDSLLNESCCLIELIHELRKDKVLKNDELRELLILKGINELQNNPQYKQSAMLCMLDSIVIQSTNKDHRKIAQNMISQISHLKVGTPAPSFSLYDLNGTLVNLSDYSGKYVYLDFWATWCKPCLQEMKIMQQLYKKYGNNIAFLSISLDQDENTEKKFLAANPKYNWTFLHYGNDKQVERKYDVRAIPTYYLVDPKGNLYQSPAFPPSEDIESVFLKLTAKPKEKFKLPGAK